MEEEMSANDDLATLVAEEAVGKVLEDAGHELRRYEALDFSGFNFEAIRNAVVDGPVGGHLPGTGKEIPPLPESNDRGEIVFELGPATMAIPEAYAPYVRYVHEVFGTPTGEEQAEFGRVLGYFHTVRQWVGAVPGNLLEQLAPFLEQAPVELAALREKLAGYADRMESDPNFEVVSLVPYMYEYLVRLMMDPEVPAEVKVDIAMGIVYFASPVDVIPEAFVDHPIAFADDACVCLWVIRALEGQVVSKDTIESNWPGAAHLPLSVDVWEKPLKELIGEDLVESVSMYFAMKRGRRILGA
jgi:uncharacterized membrane protein YkvA (DUF1232 family)